MAKHNEIVNNFKGHLEHFDFNHKEHKYLVSISHKGQITILVYELRHVTKGTFYHRYVIL